jgi:Chaperone of endosialidase
MHNLLCANSSIPPKQVEKSISAWSAPPTTLRALLTTMGVYGYSNTDGSGGKIHFGNFGSASHNVYIGEWLDVDTDQLELHGANGMVFSVGSAMETVNSTGINAGKILGDGTLYWNNDIFSTGSIISSDERLKNNRTPISNSLTTIQKLKAIKYDLRNLMQEKAETEALKNIKNAKTDKEKAAFDQIIANAQKAKLTKDQYGFSAQEIQKILPELVTTSPDGYLAVRYTALIPILVQAMQEQQAQIELLKAEIAKLKK